jgi:hypothetical protein
MINYIQKFINGKKSIAHSNQTHRKMIIAHYKIIDVMFTLLRTENLYLFKDQKLEEIKQFFHLTAI